MGEGTMLSRVADSLFWMSRYLERAEHTARLLDVNLALALEQSSRPAEQRWNRLLASLHMAPTPDEVCDPYRITGRLTFDSKNPSSIVNCISGGRENARQVREQISSEMWEQINRFYLLVRLSSIESIWKSQPHEFFRTIKEGIHFFQGLTDSTLGHGEGWQFIQVGRYLERAMATAALLSVYYGDRLSDAELEESPADQTPEYLEWVGLLKSCTAFEAYCRVYTADLRLDRIVEFLLLDPAFPHSVRFSVDMVQAALRAISDDTGRRPGDRVNRLAGRLGASLRYSHIEEIMSSGLQAYLADIEQQCVGAYESVHETYIAYPIDRALAS
jgi:uncharacterized alpha-E superfamily protein